MKSDDVRVMRIVIIYNILYELYVTGGDPPIVIHPLLIDVSIARVGIC